MIWPEKGHQTVVPKTSHLIVHSIFSSLPPLVILKAILHLRKNEDLFLEKPIYRLV